MRCCLGFLRLAGGLRFVLRWEMEPVGDDGRDLGRTDDAYREGLSLVGRTTKSMEMEEDE